MILINICHILPSFVQALQLIQAFAFFLQVENFIQSLVSHFNFLNPNTPVSLVPESSAVSHQVSHIKIELRSAISVLFAFQRQPISDEGFVSFVRNYLNQLIAILVRVATWKDHLFILNHILR